MKELTKGIVKPLKRHDWMRQPLPYVKDETKEQRKERREIYLYQRSLPAPIPYVVLHGSHTKLTSASTFRRWWFVDAQDQAMGRLATQIVRVIMGKHKPIYDPSFVVGDFVVVVNAEKVRLTGRKMDQKLYTHHTGFTGGLVRRPVKRLLAEKPEDVLRRAVSGMLPKNLLRRERLKLLRIFAGPTHPHAKEPLEPLPAFLKVPSPWVPIKEEAGEAVWDGELVLLREDGTRIPELEDNQGNKWDAAIAEQAYQEGSVIFADDDDPDQGVPHPFRPKPAAKSAAAPAAAGKAPPKK